MIRSAFIFSAAAIVLTACATSVTSPVSKSFAETAQYSKVDVTFAEDRSVPGVYDAAVQRLMDADDGETLDLARFQTYIDSHGGAGDEGSNLAERYLEYRISDEVSALLKANLTGETPVDVAINIEKVITPNAATMLLVGELKGIEYDLEVVNAVSGDVMLDLTKPSSPPVERSAGATGGLLGLALRSGKDTNLEDLEQMILAVSEEVGQIMGGTDVNVGVAKKIRTKFTAE